MAYAGGPQQPTFSSRDTAKDLLDDWVSNFYAKLGRIIKGDKYNL